MRERKDYVEVRDGENTLLALVDPRGLCEALTLGTVPIATGVVSRDGMVAAGAHIDMSAPYGGSASYYIPHDLALSEGQGMALPVDLTMPAKHVSDFEARPSLRARRAPFMVVHLSLSEPLTLRRTEHIQGALCASHVLHTHTGVSGRGPDRAMAQQHLDCARVGAEL